MRLRFGIKALYNVGIKRYVQSYNEIELNLLDEKTFLSKIRNEIAHAIAILYTSFIDSY